MRSSILTSKRAKALRRNLTDPELMLWSRLKGRGEGLPVFRSQHAFGPYILDFFCPAAGLAVEVDGRTHAQDAQHAHDERRDAWLASQGVTVHRIGAFEVFENPNQVADGVRLLADELIRKRGPYRARTAAPSTIGSPADGPPPPSSARRGRQGQ